MIIGIDASRSVETIQKTGVEKVSSELLGQFVKFKIQNSKFKINDLDFIFYTPQEISWLPRESQKILRWPVKFFWTQIRLAWELIFHPPEVMLFPVHAMPLLLITNYGLRITNYYKIIHDIAFKKQPQLYSFKQKLILNLDLWLTKKICVKIFVPTEAVRQDLIKYADIVGERVAVTPYGYNRMNNEARIMNYGEKKKQILYLGRIEEKKNIKNLIKGFELFNKKYPDYKLILAGKIDPSFKAPSSKTQFPNKSQSASWRTNPKPQNNNSETHNTLYIIHNTIEFLGYISEEQKHQLLAESSCLALVSQEEGFGFPILEAFDYGLPVVASDIPVLREVGGEACLYANPDSPEDIADKFKELVETQPASPAGRFIASQMVEKGRDRLKLFDWRDCAEKILNEMVKQKSPLS
jgi:glycosyltransferase involved in cell wall biosynthesis